MNGRHRPQGVLVASMFGLLVLASACNNGMISRNAGSKKGETTNLVLPDPGDSYPSSISFIAPVIGSFTVPVHLRTTAASIGVMYNIKAAIVAAVGGQTALDDLMSRVTNEPDVANIPVTISPAGGGAPISVSFGTLVDASHKLKNVLIVHPNGFNLHTVAPSAPDTARVLQADSGDFFIVGGMTGVTLSRSYIRISQDGANSLPGSGNAVYGSNALTIPTQYPDTSAIPGSLVTAYSGYGVNTTDLLVKLYVSGQVQYKIILRTAAGNGLLICWTVPSCAAL